VWSNTVAGDKLVIESAAANWRVDEKMLVVAAVGVAGLCSRTPPSQIVCH